MPIGDSDGVVDKIKVEVMNLIRLIAAHPPESGAPVQLVNATMCLEPWAVVRYTVDATFHTSAGLIHRELGQDMFVLSGESSQPVDPEIDDFIHEHLHSLLACPIVDDDDAKAAADSAYISLLPEAELRSAALKRIIDIHTRTVSYQVPDRSGSLRGYAKSCVPSDSDVLLDTTILRAWTIKTAIEVGGRTFDATWVIYESGKDALHLVRTDLPERLPLCQRCGGTDDRDIACAVCGRFACVRCAPRDADDGPFCSTECQEKRRRERVGALSQIGDDALRSRVANSGGLPLGVIVGGEGEIVLTSDRAFIQGSSILEIAKSDVFFVHVRPTGRWLRRLWEVIVVPPKQRESWIVGCFSGEEFAQALAKELRDWAGV